MNFIMYIHVSKIKREPLKAFFFLIQQKRKTLPGQNGLSSRFFTKEGETFIRHAFNSVECSSLTTTKSLSRFRKVPRAFYAKLLFPLNPQPSIDDNDRVNK